MDSFVTSDEKTEWPDKAGYYWFYGYRYGKSRGESDNDKELILCNVVKISNGLMVIGDGQSVWKSEVEEACFIPATLPELDSE
tara:strand:- start:4487 stop:4735 length:249 start_codon:yes stop_codon:yes gene_type:complete